jgi:hypothetical protein
MRLGTENPAKNLRLAILLYPDLNSVSPGTTGNQGEISCSSISVGLLVQFYKMLQTSHCMQVPAIVAKAGFVDAQLMCHRYSAIICHWTRERTREQINRLLFNPLTLVVFICLSYLNSL